jgi:hypothetical protein
MIDGGEEMTRTAKYLWIMTCCREEKLEPVDVLRMEEQFLA